MRKNLIFMALHFVIAKSKAHLSGIRVWVWLNAFATVYANSLFATWVIFDSAGYELYLDLLNVTQAQHAAEVSWARRPA
jgi:hypothetical protein